VASAARDIGFAHEDNPNTNWGVDYSKVSFGTLHKADERIDLSNNIIGRQIGNENEEIGMKELALKALDVFKKDGLWTATKNKDGSWSISRTKITKDQYNASKKTIQSLDENGYRKSEKEGVDKRGAEERGYVVK
jgi:hypothetical protein